MKTDDQKIKHQKDPHRKLKPVKDYVQFTGFAFQMAALLFIGYWAGSKIDDWLELKFPAFTILLILTFLALSFYSLIRKLPKE